MTVLGIAIKGNSMLQPKLIFPMASGTSHLGTGITALIRDSISLIGARVFSLPDI
jgi:hypothetical protein